MIAALDRAARSAPRTCTAWSSETRDLFRRPLEPDELKALTAVVIDPPRAGAEAQAELPGRRSGLPVMALPCPATPSPLPAMRKDPDRGLATGWTGCRSSTSSAGRTHVELVARFQPRPMTNP
jgi:hypothetical protein